MKAAQVALQNNNWGMAMNLLRGHLPTTGEAELRGIEWRYLWQESRGDELQSFTHSSMVEIGALAPDGRHLVTKSRDHRIRVWDMISRQMVREFGAIALDEPRRAVAFSPDGKWLATLSRMSHRRNELNGGKEGWVEIRATSDWSVVRELKSAEAPFCFSPDGKRLAAMEANGLAVWDLANGGHQVLTNALAGFKNLAFTPDGRKIAFCAAYPASDIRRPIQLWDIGTGNVAALDGEELSVSLAISPDGKWLASGNWRGEVCYWDLLTRQAITRFQAHPGVVFGLAFSPDGKLLATGGTDQLIHFWQAATTNRVRTLRGHLSEIWSLDFSADGHTLVSASKDGTAKLWNTKPGPVRNQTLVLPTNSVPIGFLPDGSTLVTMNWKSRTSQFWSLPGGQCISSFTWEEVAQRGCQSVEVFAWNRVVTGVTQDGTVHLWDLITRQPMDSVRFGVPCFGPRDLSADNRWLLGLHSDLTLALYDLRQAQLAKHFSEARWGGAFSPDLRWLAYATTNYTIKLWDLAARRERAILRGHRWHVDTLRFSPDSKLLATGGWDNDVLLWSVETGLPLFALKGHQASLKHVFFSSDGKTIVTASDDRQIRWWNVATGREMLLFEEVRLAPPPDFSDSAASWNVWDNIVVWQKQSGRIGVTLLPTLAEIDRIEKASSQDRY
jgi:WD40 repeat protein